MQSWSEFFFLCGSSAAALTGLMFIAVTFASRLITLEKLAYAEAFFSPIAYHFIQAFILCCVPLIPTAGAKSIGATIVITTIVRSFQLIQTFRLTRLGEKESLDIELSDWILGVVLPGANYVLFFVTAALYFAGSSAATTLFAVAILLLLVLALRRAWEMLLWVATKVD
jgi:hypothetical protein